MFLEKILSTVQSDLVVTLAMCVLGSFCVAVVMRFFVKTCLIKLDAYFEGKGDKASAIYATVKAFVYLAIAFGLTLIALEKLYSICVFPADNAKGLLPFFLIPMFALQFFLDKHMKKIACKMFGLPYEEEKEEKPAKEKKPKIHSKKVYFTIDEEGNEVPVEET